MTSFLSYFIYIVIHRAYTDHFFFDFLTLSFLINVNLTSLVLVDLVLLEIAGILPFLIMCIHLCILFVSTYDVDQNYHQDNIFNIALWLGQYLDNYYCPVVQLTTTYRYLAQWEDLDTTLVV